MQFSKSSHSFTFELNLSTFETYQWVQLGYVREQRQLKLSGNGNEWNCLSFSYKYGSG